MLRLLIMDFVFFLSAGCELFRILDWSFGVLKATGETEILVCIGSCISIKQLILF